MSEEVKRVLIDWKLVISAILFAFTIGGYALSVGKQAATFEANINANNSAITRVLLQTPKIIETDKRLLLVEQSQRNRDENMKSFITRFNKTIDKLDTLITKVNEIQYQNSQSRLDTQELVNRIEKLEAYHRK